MTVKPTPAIVLDACQTHGITEAQFYGSQRHGHVSKARQTVALALRRNGLSYSEIGKVIRRHKASVQYWANINEQRRVKNPEGKYAWKGKELPEILRFTIPKEELPHYYARGWCIATFTGDAIQIYWPKATPPK